MDVPSLVLEALVALASAAGGVAAFGYRLGRIENRVTHAEEECAALQIRLAQLQRSHDDFANEERRQWLEMNRTLGQIEGTLLPPPRPRTPSRP